MDQEVSDFILLGKLKLNFLICIHILNNIAISLIDTKPNNLCKWIWLKINENKYILKPKKNLTELFKKQLTIYKVKVYNKYMRWVNEMERMMMIKEVRLPIGNTLHAESCQGMGQMGQMLRDGILSRASKY